MLLPQRWTLFIFLISFLLRAAFLNAAELVTLHPGNYSEYVPAGKETDAIHGDYALRNDRIVAIIADPTLTRGRSASRKAGMPPQGFIIDLTRRNHPNDLLGLFMPNFIGTAPREHLPPAGDPGEPYNQKLCVDEAEAWKIPGREPRQGPAVTLTLPFTGICKEVRYILEDGWDYIKVETEFFNNSGQQRQITPASLIYMGPMDLAGRQFLYADLTDAPATWIYDPWFGQAYAVVTPGASVRQQAVAARPAWLMQAHAGDPVAMAPGKTFVITRCLVPGNDAFAVNAIACEIAGVRLEPLQLKVTEAGRLAPGVLVKAYRGNTLYAAGRTDDRGMIVARAPAGEYRLTAEPAGCAVHTVNVQTGEGTPLQELSIPTPATVTMRVTDGDGQAIPCKVEFRGIAPTPNPFFFTETGEEEVRNLRYSANGSFRQILPAGTYEIWVSHGPEYEVATRTLSLAESETAAINVTLRRVVATPGWISADFGNRSTISCSKSIASTRGRVLNLVAEQVEFAPATEEDFITSYDGYVRDLGISNLFATCPGINLTERVRKTVTSQNAFPVIPKPGYQDGGAVQRPQHVFQVYWLNGWYAPLTTRGDPSYTPGTEKLIQVTPPDIWEYDGKWHGMWMLFGATEMPNSCRRFGVEEPHRNARLHEIRCYDAMEVQPLTDFLTLAPYNPDDPAALAEQTAWQEEMDSWAETKNWPKLPQPNLWWLRILNQGWRIAGVVNGNAFANFHGSGRYRTYIKVDNDNPATLDPLAVVRAVKAGHTVMTTGPFLEARLLTDDSRQKAAGPGDDLIAPNGRAMLHIRAQAGGGTIIDTIQVLFNGHPVQELSRTRDANPELFHDTVLQFEATLPLAMKVDTRVMVLASGHGPNLYGILEPPAAPARRGATPPRQLTKTMRHVALTNPIYVDVDGNGFKPHPPWQDKVYSRVDNLTPLLTDPGAAPAKLRVRLVNRGMETAADTFHVEFRPPDSAAVVGDNSFSYKLAPGAETTIDFQVKALGSDAKTVRVGIPRSSVGAGRHACAVTIRFNDKKVRDPEFKHENNWWLPEHDVSRPPNWFWPEFNSGATQP